MTVPNPRDARERPQYQPEPPPRKEPAPPVIRINWDVLTLSGLLTLVWSLAGPIIYAILGGLSLMLVDYFLPGVSIVLVDLLNAGSPLYAGAALGVLSWFINR